MMNKLYAIHMCVLFIVLSIVIPLVLPALTVLVYMEEGFNGVFIFVAITTILIEPLTIEVSYILLTIIKDTYNDLRGI